MVREIRLRQRRKLLKQLGTAAASLFVVGGAAYVAADRWLWPEKSPPGGIACSEVGPLLPAYCEQELEPTLAEKVTVHLDACPECGPAYEKMVAGKTETAHAECCRGHHGRSLHQQASIG